MKIYVFFYLAKRFYTTLISFLYNFEIIAIKFSIYFSRIFYYAPNLEERPLFYSLNKLFLVYDVNSLLILKTLKKFLMSLFKNNLKKIIKFLFEKINYDFRSNIIFKTYLYYRKYKSLPGNTSSKYFEEIKRTIFISSKGFINNADHHDKFQQSGSSSLSINIKKIHKGDSVYVCSNALETFADMLPKINQRIVLFSGDSTIPINKDNFPKAVNNIPNNEYLINWYAQNLDFDHETVKPLPLGMDYHTGFNNPNFFKGERLLPSQQEKKIINISANANFLTKRKLKIYSNWHFFLERGDRSECLEQIDKRICHFESCRIERFTSYENQTEFAFVTSPFGSGYDCHRTYEAILLGSIPIIKQSGISKLFENLPVCIVKEWNEVDEQFLEDNLKYFLKQRFNFSSLFNDYWLENIYRKKYIYKGLTRNNSLKKMTLLEFNEYTKYLSLNHNIYF